MIEVRIVESMSLVALCTITGDNDEFTQDLERLKDAVDWQDREFVDNVFPHYWRVRNAAKYAAAVPEIREAIRDYRRQMKLPGIWPPF
jgi:acetone carboxylase gamma subunit